MIRKPYRVISAREEKAAGGALAPVPRVAVSLPEAAAALGICEDTVRALAHAGTLPTFTQGRRILVRVAALDAYAAAQEAAHMADIKARQESEARHRQWRTG